MTLTTSPIKQNTDGFLIRENAVVPVPASGESSTETARGIAREGEFGVGRAAG